MKKSRFTESQIVDVLKKADAGIPVKDICRQAGISSGTFYNWQSKYAGLEVNEAKCNDPVLFGPQERELA